MKHWMIILGLVLAILGGIGLAIESVSWNENRTLVEIGSFEASASIPQYQQIPPLYAGGALVIGLALTGIGAAKPD